MPGLGSPGILFLPHSIGQSSDRTSSGSRGRKIDSIFMMKEILS